MWKKDVFLPLREIDVSFALRAPFNDFIYQLVLMLISLPGRLQHH